MSYNPQNPNGQATSANSAPVVLSSEQEGLVGALTETAPATDTASSGLNGRLQRIAQRLTTMLTGLALAAGTNLIGKVAAAQQTDVIMNGTTALTPGFAAIAAATSGDNTLRTNPNAGKKIRVLAMCVIAGTSGNIYFTSDAGGTVIFGGSTNKINLAANGGFVLPYNPLGWFETAADADLVMNASSTGPFSGGFVYAEI